MPAQPRRYDPFAMSLHWLIALLVITCYAVGIYREGLPKTDFRAWLLSFHMWLGMAVLILTVVRIGWRKIMPPPPHLPAPRMQTLAAKAGHFALLLFTILLPVIGLLAAWLKARNVTFFGYFPLPSPFAVDKLLAGNLEHLHEFAAHGMMLLAGGHAMIAILHQYMLRDGTLGRMLPLASAEPRKPSAMDLGGPTFAS